MWRIVFLRVLAQAIRKAAKLFIFCLCFALCPLAFFGIGWLLRVLLKCGNSINSFSCEYLPALADTLMLMVLLGGYILIYTIPVGVMLFVFGIVFLSISRKSLIRWIQAILLLPTILGLMLFVITKCSTYIAL